MRERNIKKVVAGFAVCLGLLLNAQAGLYWGSGSANTMTDFNGNPVPTSDSHDSSVGAFAQLLRIDSGSTPAAFSFAGNGASAGDTVVDTMYSGLYDDLSLPGTFPFNPTTIFSDSSFNGWYYARVYDKPVSTFDNGNDAAVVGTGPGYYWESAPYEYTHNELWPSEFQFGPGQTLNAIPEPTTFAFIGIGMLAFVARKKMRV